MGVIKIYEEWAKFGAKQRLEFQEEWRKNHEIIKKLNIKTQSTPTK